MAMHKKTNTVVSFDDGYFEHQKKLDEKRRYYFKWSLKFIFVPTMLTWFAISFYIIFGI